MSDDQDDRNVDHDKLRADVALVNDGFWDKLRKTLGRVPFIEDALAALGATGGEGQLHRVAVSSLPVASVLTVGMGAPPDDWPADKVRRAAGAAARSLEKAQSVVTTL